MGTRARRAGRSKDALITGCDYGLGVDLAKTALSRGYRVFAGCRNPGTAREMKRLSEAYGRSLVVFKIDMSSESSIRRACSAVKRGTRRISLLINDAGICFYDRLDKINFRDFQRMFTVNAFGPAFLVRCLHSELRRGKAKIVNISSEAGSLAKTTFHRTIYAYGASKAALNMLSRRMAAELAGEGISVLCVHPGWMRTPMGYMGGKNPTMDPADSARDIFKLADRLSVANTGRFFEHRGPQFPW